MKWIDRIVRKSRLYKELEQKKIRSQQEVIDGAKEALGGLFLRVSLNQAGDFDIGVKATVDGYEPLVRKVQSWRSKEGE